MFSRSCYSLAICAVYFGICSAQIGILKLENISQMPQCSSEDINPTPIVLKNDKVILEIPSRLDSSNSTILCPILLRSPFRCAHPYSVQVFEDAPEKCLSNIQNCVLHQQIYWTRNGELEIQVKTPPQSRRLILHVIRLDCAADKEPHSSHALTSKLRVRIETAAMDPSWLETVKDDENDGFKVTEEGGNAMTGSLPRREIDSGAAARNNFLYPPENRHFYLTSPGFPRNSQTPTDCQFVIPPTYFQTCRLRISFRHFNLPDPDPRTCLHHFLVIDNKRICGCKSGLFYLSQMDHRPKIIRYVNRLNGGSGRFPAQSYGFLLEVQREGCPQRLQSASRIKEVEPLISFSRNPNQQCHFSFNDWLSILANPLWSNRRPQCTRTEWNAYF